MRYVEFTQGNRTRPGLLVGDTVVDTSLLGHPTTLNDWMRLPADRRRDLAEGAVTTGAPVWPLAEVQLQAPLTRPRKIVAIGLNYLDHCREQGIDPPAAPLVFGKFPSAIIGPGDPIEWDPGLTQAVDPEVELGVVIGARCRDVSADRALDVVFGYTVANDVSARDLQFGDGQWTRGKNLDTFCPLGPCIVTSDEIRDPQALAMRLRVNDRVQQTGTTADMIFSVAEIIVHVTRFMTLEPGDLLLTGTPWGVGCFRSPPVYLTAGDEVTCTIEGIGTLRNPTRARPHAEGGVAR